MLESHLMQVDEAPELFADAVLVDPADNLLFLSLWGRDTALQAFLARLSLPHHEGGLDSFFLRPDTQANGRPRRKRVQIGDTDRLDHYSGRMPMNIFGDMARLHSHPGKPGTRPRQTQHPGRRPDPHGA